MLCLSIVHQENSLGHRPLHVKQELNYLWHILSVVPEHQMEYMTTHLFQNHETYLYLKLKLICFQTVDEIQTCCSDRYLEVFTDIIPCVNRFIIFTPDGQLFDVCDELQNVKSFQPIVVREHVRIRNDVFKERFQQTGI
ncbi:hypothetical protein [Salmon gill poxvirus]|nr:hypothetical protein [Salmon gill poxvirus]